MIRTFGYMEVIWKERAKNTGNKKLGHKAYAAREIDKWHRWAEIATTEFAKVLELEIFPITK